MSDLGAAVIVFLLALVLVGGSCMAYPQYNVYSARLSGEAKKAEAEGSRMAIVSQAKAEREAAVERAEAIKIVGEATKKFPEYRQQEFIGAFGEALREGTIKQIVYVPTEAMIPIMEARASKGESE